MLSPGGGVGMQLGFYPVLHFGILERLNPGHYDLRELACPCTQQRIGRQERRKRHALFEVLQDRHRLSEMMRSAARLEFEHRYVAHRIQCPKRRKVLFATFAGEMHRHVLVRNAFVSQRDSHTPGRRTPPKSVKPHAATLANLPHRCEQLEPPELARADNVRLNLIRTLRLEWKLSTTLLAFHGFSLNGARMEAQLAALTPGLPEELAVVCPDAPHSCELESVERLHQRWGIARLPPPYLHWWNATDDGSDYRGWETTREFVRELLLRHAPVGILGFSQGGILATAIAALSHAGELPPIRFAVIVAGSLPRSQVIKPFLATNIAVPSLHVWGEKDTIAASAPAALECFDPATREQVIWPGAHSLPATGPGALAIVNFVRRHS